MEKEKAAGGGNISTIFRPVTLCGFLVGVVMVSNADITVINKHGESYFCAPISGVFFTKQDTRNVDEKGIHRDVAATIRIPTYANTGGKTYITSEYWEALDDVTGYWTLQQGLTDYIISGLEPDALNGEINREALSRFIRRYQPLTICGVSDNRYGSVMLHHWKVVCK